ncbi:hypothetical protein V7S43_002006 [Phytophthora oleae]|uniref:Uncharacterized protein n=1 Tax=Phytophthora oleae TaxID=2107226 RepID=A0ABD3G165_9STRA
MLRTRGETGGVGAAPSTGLILDMHRKRRVIQSARNTKLEGTESKKLIQKISVPEQELKLVGCERRLKKTDQAFLVWEQRSLQSIGTSRVLLVFTTARCALHDRRDKRS